MTTDTTSRAPRLGVVVPSHNRPSLLRQALDSLARQRDEDLRVVVVDEASIPPIDPAAFPRELDVTLLRNDAPVGPGAARNQGVAALGTPFVAFLDDDDVYLPDKAAASLAVFDAHAEAGTVVHRAVFDGVSRQGTGTVTKLEDPVRTWLRSQPPHVNTVVVRREVHESVQFDESFTAAADLDYMLRLAAEAPVLVLDEVHAVHGRPADRQSSISIARRLAGRQMFREKHAHLFDREADAFHLMRTGHLHRRAGARTRAAAAFVHSLRVRPTGAAARGLLLTAIPTTAATAMIRRRFH
ncbi:MAG: glycosyltransferase family 2 protein [Actinomycetes bacterium]